MGGLLLLLDYQAIGKFKNMEDLTIMSKDARTYRLLWIQTTTMIFLVCEVFRIARVSWDSTSVYDFQLATIPPIIPALVV